MRKFLLIVIAAFFSVSAIFSQTVMLSGKVTDGGNQETLYGVNIIINNTNQLLSDKSQLGTTTDFDGVYKTALYPGTYDIHFVYIGYEEVVKTVELIVGKPVVIDVALVQKAEIIEEVVVRNNFV